jgi:hypothetical protein
LSVTVPVAAPLVRLLRTDEGEIDRVAISASASVSVAERVMPAKVAVTVAVLLATPGVVVIENVAVALPVGTVSEAGTVPAASFDESETTRLAAATPFSVTVPVAGVPPSTEEGEMPSPDNCAGRTESKVVAEY